VSRHSSVSSLMRPTIPKNATARAARFAARRAAVEVAQQRDEARAEDDDDLGPLERPAQPEDDERGDDPEAERLPAASAGRPGRAGPGCGTCPRAQPAARAPRARRSPSLR